MISKVVCESHPGTHTERADCRWPHFVHPAHGTPWPVQDESGDLTGQLTDPRPEHDGGPVGTARYYIR